MSSFIGHGLAAVTTYAAVSPARRPFQSQSGALLWFCWLIVIAWVPDIDHVVPALKMSQNNGMRITHAFASSLLLPVMTMAGLALWSWWRGRWRPSWQIICAWQSAIAGLSHPLMDWWVGVIGLPLFWPFYPEVIRAPVGLLPSAGSLRWNNYYFYANLWIELGILIPIITLLLGHMPWRKHPLRSWQTIVLTGISIYFLNWSMGLSR